MPTTLETRFTSEVGWNWLDSANNSATRTQGNFRRQASFSSASIPKIDGVWYQENATLPALSAVTHDLANLTQSIYGNDIPIHFASLCSLYIHNRSETHSLVIANTGSTTASNIVSSSFLNLIVPPGGFFTLCNPQADWNISNTRNEIKLQNAFSEPISYDIILTGTLRQE